MTESRAGRRLASKSVLHPVMSSSGLPEWAGARWVGVLDDPGGLSGPLHLGATAGYRAARLLVRTGGQPRGFVEVPIVDGGVRVDDVVRHASVLPRPARRMPLERPPISIVVCTRDRPDLLVSAVSSLLSLSYPEFEIIVVDNAPRRAPAADSLAELLRDPARALRVADAPQVGLSRARNIGLLIARHDVVAFTDDDVVVDPGWLEAIALGFGQATDVGCVTGMVPSGELRSPAQAYFDRRVSWARSCAPALHRLAGHDPDDVLFPFQVGRFGTGANFALDRRMAIQLGGFDEGLGVGSRTAGGEDIDMFVRVLLSGRALAYEPSAVVWHRHRLGIVELEGQIHDYGSGLGAWLTKLLTQPRTAPMVLSRALAGIRHLRRITQVAVDETIPPATRRRLGRIERRAVGLGVLRLCLARLSGARARPLLELTHVPAAPSPSR